MAVWEDTFNRLCIENSIEPVIDGSNFILVVPKMPSEEVQQKIRELVPPQIQYQYREAPKISTTEGLRVLLLQAGAQSALVEIKEHILSITIQGDVPILTEQDSHIWPVIQNLLKADQFVEGWKVTVNGTLMSQYDRKMAAALSTQVKPERDTSILQDEITDLRITLENCQDVNDFISTI